VCAFTGPLDFSQLCALRTKLPVIDHGVDLTLYTAAKLDALAEIGSLFLWHLKLEGRLLLDRDGYACRILSNLKPFSRFDSEIFAYTSLLSDVRHSLLTRENLLEIDLHVLQMICRNTFILLTYAARKPAFGRVSSFQRAREIYENLPVNRTTYDQLCRWHFAYRRGLPPSAPFPSRDRASVFVDNVDALIRFAAGVLT
jgi:hypothetical protein